jgi:hypothetical protein
MLHLCMYSYFSMALHRLQLVLRRNYYYERRLEAKTVFLMRIPLNGLTKNTRNLSMTSYLRFELGTSKTQARYAVTVRIEIHLCFMALTLAKKNQLYGFLNVKLFCCDLSVVQAFIQSQNVYPSSGRIYTHLVEIRTNIRIIFITNQVIIFVVVTSV